MVIAAFGCPKAAPGPISTVLPDGPKPVTIDRRWLAALGHAARGQYAAARADLAIAARLAESLGPETSNPAGSRGSSGYAVRLARVRVAAASFARQLGDHRAAGRLDGGAAVLLAGLDRARLDRAGLDRAGLDRGEAAGCAESSASPEARFDAVRAVRIDILAGSAADALGDGTQGNGALGNGGVRRAERIADRIDLLLPAHARFSTSAGGPRPFADRLVAGAGDLCASQAPGRGPAGRELVRVGWVRAEIAMSAGDGPTALAAADDALGRALTGASCRHRIKSGLVLAAAYVVAGEPDVARPLLERVSAAAADHGYLPLVWAAGMLAPAVRLPAPDIAAVAAELGRRGGRPVQLGGRSATR